MKSRKNHWSSRKLFLILELLKYILIKMKEVKFDVYCDSTLFNDRSDLST